MDILPFDEARNRLRADHELLLTRVADLTEAELAAGYRPASGPLGDFCDSLHDLVAHVLMWDEISLAVLTEARAGRTHWSLDPRWETPEAGRRLNLAGVRAGRHLPGPLLLHRFRAVHDAISREFGRFSEDEEDGEPGWSGIGELVQRAWTVPGQPAFWHAAIHLNELAVL